jgi:hypothetical protein
MSPYAPPVALSAASQAGLMIRALHNPSKEDIRKLADDLQSAALTMAEGCIGQHILERAFNDLDLALDHVVPIDDEDRDRNAQDYINDQRFERCREEL